MDDQQKEQKEVNQLEAQIPQWGAAAFEGWH